MQAEGPLTPRAALDILDPVLQALGAAHSAGLIHRDVKPENVILREDGVVKVADFGLARAVTSATSTAQTGVLLGTVAYLSPEQVERGIADARSDVYAAGLLLFEMLTGTKAFSGDTPIHVAYQHVHCTVPAPSSRVSTVPPGLDRLVALATDRDPDGRPVDAGAFLVELRRTASGPDARPSWTCDPARPRLPRSWPPPWRCPGRGAAAATRTRTATARGTAAPPSYRPAARRRRRPAPVPAVGGPGRCSCSPSSRLRPARGSSSPARARRTTVPAVVSLTLAQAEQRLTSSHLTAHVERAFDEKVRAGVVLTSDPGAGADLGRGSSVRLTVSKGPERYTVPDLVGGSRSDAERQLSARRLQVGEVSQAYDETIPAGQVISTDPAAGASVKRATQVALVLSKGREPIDVVDWTGQPADAAVASLTNAGLTVDATRQEFSTTVPKGSRGPPGPGRAARSSAAARSPSWCPRARRWCKVPDVERKQEDEARAILERAGFKVEVQRFLGGAFGTVRLQDPAGGSMAPKGSTVTLTVV